MIYCITLIIIVALICATRLYPLWVEHNRQKVNKTWELVRKVREENVRLREEINRSYDGWLAAFLEKQKAQDETFDKICEILKKLDKKVSKEFFFKVATLRYYQKEYFATRSRAALEQSKALEREIDVEIDRVNKILKQKKNPQPVQGDLFNNDNPKTNENRYS